MDSHMQPSTLKITTENEHVLYRMYKEEQREREKMETVIVHLQSEIKELRQHLEELSKKKITVSMATQTADDSYAKQTTSDNKAAQRSSQLHVDYETDEEELAKETEWIRVKSRKKRKLNTSPSQSYEEEGNINDHSKKTQTSKPKKMPAPPPIIVDGVENYQTFYDLLNTTLTESSFTIKMMSGKNVKVSTLNDESYRATTTLLKDKKFLWHSYENKRERPIRVMVKKLPHTCEPIRIIEDLKAKGFKIEEAVNKLRWKTKEPLNMFLLAFNNEENIDKIYNIKSILGCHVEIQPLRTQKIVPQCKRCQAYGHTQRYCAKEPRCVKCTGKHLTKDCIRSADEQPKCVHCGESHPANYRGCIVAKEIQKMKKKITNSKPTVFKQGRETNLRKTGIEILPNQKLSKHITDSTSYAEALNKKNPKFNNLSTPNKSIEEKIDTILNIFSQFDERLKIIECSTKNAAIKNKK